MRLLLNKKGSLMDAITVPAFILLTSLTVIISIFVWVSFQDNFTEIAQESPGNETIINTMESITKSIYYLDYMIPLLVGGLLVVSLVFAFRTGASVVYFYLSIILWAIAMIMSEVFSEVFKTFEISFPNVASSLPILVYIMHNMRWVVLSWLALISFVMFTRTKKEDESLAYPT
jgi:hypothetical protein